MADANQAVERLLGIGYDGFSQSVILPQGQFDRFLRSQGGARRGVLTELLRLERYERMRRFAVQSKDRTAVEVQSIERQLTEYGQATPESLERTRVSVAVADEAVKQNADSRSTAEGAVSHLRARRQMTCDLEEKEEALRKLLACEATVEADRGRVLASRRAAPVVPLIQAASEARKRAKDAHQALTVLENEAREGKRAFDQAASSLETATNAANAIPAMLERIQALDRLHGAFAHMRQVRTKVDEWKKKSLKTGEAARLAKQAFDGAV